MWFGGTLKATGNNSLDIWCREITIVRKLILPFLKLKIGFGVNASDFDRPGHICSLLGKLPNDYLLKKLMNTFIMTLY